MVSQPISQVLWGRRAGCLSIVEPTSQALLGNGAGFFRGVGTYLPGTVGQGGMHCRASVQAV